MGNPWFIAMTVAAFTAFISYIQIGSYAADKNPKLKRNWWILAIVMTVLAVFFLWKVQQTSTGQGG